VRVALVFDMEGAAHIQDPRDVLPMYPGYWDIGRRALMIDIAAAAQGLLDAGVDEVGVISHHGAGENPWPNVIETLLPEGARSVDWEMKDLAEQADAMIQVGCHAPGGSPSFLSHTFLPGFRMRMGDEVISESHEWAFAAGVPLLGIVGSEALQRERGASLADVPFLAVQTGEGHDVGRPVLGDAEQTAAAIRTFAAGSIDAAAAARPLKPTDVSLVASLHNARDVGNEVVAAGWTRLSETEFALEGATWAEVDDAVWEAVELAYRPYTWMFPEIDWTEENAMALDAELLERIDAVWSGWTQERHPAWFAPTAQDTLEGFPQAMATD